MNSPRPSLARSAYALLLPLLLVVVFAMHLRGLPAFLDFHLHYDPAPPSQVVPAIIARGGGRPLLHDPHVIAYLGLPLFLVSSLALYRRGRGRRPRASAWAFAVTAVGTIYLGGLFGMWTAFYDGLSHVDARYADGATATFAAMSSPHGAFLLTTTLAKLAFVGLGMQGVVLWGRAFRQRVAAVAVALGSALFLVFWDLDNWMLIGSLLLLTGLIASAREQDA